MNAAMLKEMMDDLSARMGPPPAVRIRVSPTLMHLIETHCKGTSAEPHTQFDFRGMPLIIDPELHWLDYKVDYTETPKHGGRLKP